MRISFIVANIDLFHFLVNPHVTHALFVAHMIPLLYEDHWRASFRFIILSKIKYHFVIFDFYCKPHYCKTMTL
ncbi:hypothetical protein HanIR_Chr10g0467371 [Helianthus annuus]|nr:hypothetical protein HanIR_Chr10g0467371 [Helianthus annuus]